MEQHDQFCCFALAGMASKYYTLLLETDPGVCLGVILKKFKKCFGSSAPGLTHQLNFDPVSSAGQWRVPPPVARPSSHLGYAGLPSALDVHAQVIPRLCYGAEDKDAGMYALDGHPRRYSRRWARRSFSSIRERGHCRNLCVMW